MSPSIPPNSSSDGGAGAPHPIPASRPEQEADAGSLRDLVGRLAEQFGAGPETIARVAALFGEVREHAPDLFVPAAGALAAAFESVVVTGGTDAEPVYAALGEWALDAEGEPVERMRRDCLRFQDAMTRGVLRLHSGNPERYAESLSVLHCFILLQVAVLASLTARGREGGGVVRVLQTPEYAAFMEICRTAIESHRQDGKQLALLVIQIARVEQVDRLLGLQKGEAFMLRVTRRMREGVLRKQDQLGRVSRDQFACLLPRIAGEGVAILAASKILGALEAPIPLGDRSFSPDAVIGIAVYPDHGEDSQTLVRNGKLAALAARGGTDRVAVYDPAHGESEERQVRYETRLRHALEQNTLQLAFEPQLDLNTGRIGGLECILHWTDEELGEVPEARTYETAETAGLVREVTWWVFNNGLRLCADFARAGLQCKLGLKVTASGLLQPDFPEFVRRALGIWGVSPSRVVIGIHETALSGGLDQIRETLARLKTFGVRLGIDGFGSGSSSVNNLAQLPLDEMKISATFVADMKRSDTHAKVVRSLAHLARDFGMSVTAEGVEDGATAVALTGLGAERVQGKYVSPPLSGQEILVFEKSVSGLTKLKISDL